MHPTHAIFRRTFLMNVSKLSKQLTTCSQGKQGEAISLRRCTTNPTKYDRLVLIAHRTDIGTMRGWATSGIRAPSTHTILTRSGRMQPLTAHLRRKMIGRSIGRSLSLELRCVSVPFTSFIVLDELKFEFIHRQLGSPSYLSFLRPLCPTQSIRVLSGTLHKRGKRHGRWACPGEPRSDEKCEEMNWTENMKLE